MAANGSPAGATLARLSREEPIAKLATAVVLLAVALLAVGCSGDGEGPSTTGDGPGSSVTAAPPETTEPPEAQPPETTQPPDTTQPPTETTEATVEESSGIPTGVWILLGVTMGAIGIGIFIGSRSSDDD